jgi:hypothetical protein
VLCAKYGLATEMKKNKMMERMVNVFLIKQVQLTKSYTAAPL